MYTGKGGSVNVPSWVLVLRFFQLFFAILIIALTAYPLSVSNGGPMQPALIATLVIACITVLPIIIIATPLHLIQHKLYDPRLVLISDGIECLFWLGAWSALASYQRIFRWYGSAGVWDGFRFDEVCGSCRRAWRVGNAATVFAAFEFLLFLATTLIFLHYYHCHCADILAPGLGGRDKGSGTTTSHSHSNTKAGAAMSMATSAPAPAPVTTGNPEAGTTGRGVSGTSHEAAERSIQPFTHPNLEQNTSSGEPGVWNRAANCPQNENEYTSHGNTGPAYDVPYPTIPRHGGYGSGCGNGSNNGYGTGTGNGGAAV
ncbi:hypothetical protein BCR34DRAFT_653195 [Clohesyomyces aquaticus]|uniref:MARVEL domain-containing protein n=1 Tax=Clohesyomyces aquaticus TaxID=1231657 RepID=A0A1Y1ZLW2_9PLEO|nr:hypothetical protein BCR34DRAFT_653195 [Clohesyomyces aquaticus]